MDQKIKVLVFEFTNQVNLHEHLLLNSPASDFSKSPTYLSNGRTGISMETLVKMAFQVRYKQFFHMVPLTASKMYCKQTNIALYQITSSNIFV